MIVDVKSAGFNGSVSRQLAKPLSDGGRPPGGMSGGAANDLWQIAGVLNRIRGLSVGVATGWLVVCVLSGYQRYSGFAFDRPDSGQVAFGLPPDPNVITVHPASEFYRRRLPPGFRLGR